jgi:hypothetical protein
MFFIGFPRRKLSSRDRDDRRKSVAQVVNRIQRDRDGICYKSDGKLEGGKQYVDRNAYKTGFNDL